MALRNYMAKNACGQAKKYEEGPRAAEDASASLSVRFNGRLENEEQIDICNYTLAIIADTTAARASAVRRPQMKTRNTFGADPSNFDKPAMVRIAHNSFQTLVCAKPYYRFKCACLEGIV